MTQFHQALDKLADFVSARPHLVILSGAGISVASGIPTYRDAEGSWRHSRPITHQEFVSQPARRRRYWARSMHGWPVVRDAAPNKAHLALAALERHGKIDQIITQNVDRLHQRAGSAKVIDLHGRVDQVLCMDCSRTRSREAVQRQLLQDNPFAETVNLTAGPDGDADIDPAWLDDLRVPHCDHCQGTLIPDVVFFGGSVPKKRVTECNRAITEADALLAVGSSLQVFSGFRFCRLAKQLGKPLAIINPGKTRADPMADCKIEFECGPLLDALSDALAETIRPPNSCAGGNPS